VTAHLEQGGRRPRQDRHRQRRGQCANRLRRRLAVAGGLKQIGVNLLELEPGAWSSQRHWHTRGEEFVCVLEGEVGDGRGEEILRAGDSAAFRAGDSNGHHLQNRSQVRARVLKIGSANLRDDEAQYQTS
jgi:uncharacterized cupin superfamily protein